MRSAVYPFPEKRQRQACERDPCGEVWGGPNQGASPYQPGNFQLGPGPITSSSLEINALTISPWRLRALNLTLGASLPAL